MLHMKTSSKKLTTSVEITVTFDRNDLEPARIKALERLAHGIKISGFRKGKAPANVVEKHVDPNELASQTLDIAIRSSLPEVFKKEKIEPISMPHVNVTKYVPGEMAEFVVESDILPEVKLGDYKKLKTKREKVKIDDTEIQDTLDKIAKAQATPKVVKREAKLGDQVIIDFVGKKDGVAFDGGSGKDVKLELGSNQFIPGFEDGVVGHSSGDKFTLELTFPEDYHNADLAGQATEFDVLLKQVNEMEVPAIDDNLAQKTGAFATLKELKEDIKKNLTARVERQVDEQYKDALVMELVGKSQLEAPKTLVEEQFQSIQQDLERNLQARGITSENYFGTSNQNREEWEKDARKVAEDRILASLVLQALARELNIEVDDKAVDQKISELKTVYKNNEDAVAQLDDPRVRADIKNRMKIDATIDELIQLNTPKTSEKSDKKD